MRGDEPDPKKLACAGGLGHTFAMKDMAYLLAVHKAMRLTQTRFQQLGAFFGHDWQAVWNSSESDFLAAKIDRRGRDGFFEKRGNISPEAVMASLDACEAIALVHGQAYYPAPLLPLTGAPVVLFCRGEIIESDFPAVAVVGSRRLSAYAKRAIEHLTEPLSRAGLTIVSGLAMGADALAHEAAMNAGGRTIAVLGNGIDSIYPRSSAGIAERILDGGGAILSEYFPGTEPRPEHFPVRNRIVAGLSRGVVVAAAQAKSGSLITGRLAVEQGRDVFAVPGSIFDAGAAGTNELIQKGQAHPATSAEYVLEVLGLDQKQATGQVQMELPMGDIEREIVAAFGVENEQHINDLIRALPHDSAVVGAHVQMLSLKGALRHMGNQMYALNL